MAGPLQLAEVCDPCKLGDIELNGDDALILADGSVETLVSISRGGVELEKVPDDAYDAETRQGIPNQVIRLAKSCARTIMADECPVYVISDNGKLESRKASVDI